MKVGSPLVAGKKPESKNSALVKNLSCLLVDQFRDSKNSETFGGVVKRGYRPIGLIFGCENVGVNVVAELGRKVEKAKRRLLFARQHRIHGAQRCG